MIGSELLVHQLDGKHHETWDCSAVSLRPPDRLGTPVAGRAPSNKEVRVGVKCDNRNFSLKKWLDVGDVMEANAQDDVGNPLR